jgi:hydroxyacylglutathione hydrolase
MFRSSYATWLGWLVPLGTPLLFVTDSVPLENILDETLLVGHERFVGWLDGGITAWEAAGLPLQSIEVIDAESARKMIADGAAALDVREMGEFASGHVQGADHVPLGSLQQHLDDVPRDRPVVTYCGMGERATSAASLLERAGFRAVLNLKGGVRAWKEAGYELAV